VNLRKDHYHTVIFVFGDSILPLCFDFTTDFYIFIKPKTTFSSGCLGSHIDEERCELRYVMRIAQLSESLKF
jgi:hypothetical protein